MPHSPAVGFFTVDTVNVEQLYLAIKKIILNEEFAEKMGEKSLEIIESRYSLDKTVNGFVSAIKYVIHNDLIRGAHKDSSKSLDGKV